MIVTATIYIHGDNLDPDEITRLTGFDPNSSYRKDDVLTSGYSAKSRVADTGLWAWSTGGVVDSDAISDHVEFLIENFLTLLINLRVLGKTDYTKVLAMVSLGRGERSSSEYKIEVETMRKLVEGDMALVITVLCPITEAEVEEGEEAKEGEAESEE